MAQPRELHLARAFSQCPITALAFFRAASYLLAGEDTHLAIYDLRAGHVVARVRVFPGQPIHGIRVLNGRVLLWGAAKIAAAGEDALEELIQGGDPHALALKRVTAPDWIYDAALSPFDTETAALITAHNEVIPVRFDSPDGTPILGAVVSPSRPMLYAANLKWVSNDCILVAGGTVFGDILMWKYHLNQEQSEMISVLAGHEGSIFGVHISDELPCADGSKIRLLASCSDDRTVRIWDVTDRQGEKVGGNTQHELVAPRETGFGSTPGLGGAETERPVAVVMGHASRIWGVKFAPSIPGDVQPAKTLAVYSFGEDSTMQRWRLDLDTSSSGDARDPLKRVSAVIKHQETIDVHDGKHLWSHAITTVGGRTLIATGGADSKISLLTESTTLTPGFGHKPIHETTTLNLQEVLGSLPNASVLPRGRGPEIIGRYDFFSQDEVLATTSLGRLMLGTFDKGLQWREVHLEDSIAAGIRSCYVLKTIGNGAALLGTNHGGLYHYCGTQGMTFIGTVPGKVVNIVLLTEAHDTSVELLIHLHGTPDAQFFALDWHTGAVLATADVRGMDPRFVAMSAAKIKGGLIAIGSRHGWLSVLRQGEEGFRPVLDFATSSRDAITGIVPLPGNDTDGTASPYFLSTSRDSNYRIYEIENADSDVRLHLRNETAPPFGSIIEGGWFTRDADPELILYGFKSKKLIVWNETRREEIATIECGGAHRTFTLMHNPTDPHHLRFGFTRTSKLFIYSQSGSVHRPIKTGTHGREIRTLSCNGRYIATGSEDTTVQIWEYSRQQQGAGRGREMRCLASMKLHIAGMQQVKWLGEDYLLSSAGNEEFFVWRVRKLKNTTYRGLGVLCEAVFDDKSKHGDLRIMDFEASKVGPNGNIIITMVLSNSTLKTYCYTPGASFRLLAQMSYTGACLTQVRHLGVDENGLSALTASTDGHLATWEARFDHVKTVSHVLVHVAPVHQNGIKSLDLRATPEGFQVLTGGDDNGLGVTSLAVLSDEAGIRRYTVSGRGIVRKAHAAAINGVALIQRGEATLGVSVSNDQRVKIWQISAEKTELVADEYSGVADPGGVEVMASTSDDENSDRLIVGGVGIEVWTV